MVSRHAVRNFLQGLFRAAWSVHQTKRGHQQMCGTILRNASGDPPQLEPGFGPTLIKDANL
jgi:hypothetical protein